MKKRNGSVIIVTLLCCFILSCICLGCIELVKTNNDIVSTKEKSMKIEYEVKGGINLGCSKVAEEVNNLIGNNIEENNLECKFKDHFLGNNKINIIRSIESMGNDKLKIRVVNNDIYLDDDYIKLDIESKKEDSNFKKIARCSVKINIKSIEENEKRVFKYNYKEI
ncbi:MULTISPECIES: hypothetical protein [Paraclostridium]|uniref:Lipoprotein n=1 Tax=Paraclostridium benzoelyticum TaxID=1629550 RepID=A0A0M3DNG3_9FIRM|nr:MULTISPECIES: hypothetical protein [Paraclostridium]KKY01845.1 hypothetical protein VN21_06610 [Paraclostridium benzoelyticum]KKY02994.1 hypothetical protein VN21_00120 [Paraclostridium benzoelyticum]MCU9813811.1 hypothetical protein [Paraclostridium sp. AKS73]